jgi:CheY-like chemotaxis protein/HPt (histidine-containing phosphotransfer) domain-containing protein
MDGQIGVGSRPGEGSTFWFRLSLPLSDEVPSVSTPDVSLVGLRVLIVDDNEVNRRVLHEQISSWGMRNGGFASGAQALVALREALAEGDPYHLAIVDYMMPDMDGEMLAREIKADPELRETVLIMLTSVSGRNDAKRMTGAGFAAYLVKPARQSQLMDALVTAWAAKLKFGDSVFAPGDPGDSETSAFSILASEPARAHVLVVEDLSVNQDVATKMLQKLGCQVSLACNGRQAVEMVGNVDYDLVFMDCQMPEMDGYEATARIRQDEEPGARIPIVAMTAHAMVGDREKCLQAGMDDYLSKPLRFQDLEMALQQWVRPRRRRHRVTGSAVKQSSEAPTSKIITRLREIAGDDDRFIHELLEKFIQEATATIPMLRNAMEAGDSVSVQRLAHRLKGMSSNIGSTAIANACRQLEAIAEMPASPEAVTLIRLVEVEVEHVGEALESVARARENELDDEKSYVC